jgi:hypothetical protein
MKGHTPRERRLAANESRGEDFDRQASTFGWERYVGCSGRMVGRSESSKESSGLSRDRIVEVAKELLRGRGSFEATQTHGVKKLLHCPI